MHGRFSNIRGVSIRAALPKIYAYVNSTSTMNPLRGGPDSSMVQNNSFQLILEYVRKCLM